MQNNSGVLHEVFLSVFNLSLSNSVCSYYVFSTVLIVAAAEWLIMWSVLCKKNMVILDQQRFYDE